MAKSKFKNMNLVDKLRDKATSVWGLLISGLTLFGFGFGVGCYITSTLSDLKRNDDEFKRQMELIEMKAKYEDKIFELRNNIYVLQKKCIDYGESEKR